MALTRDFKETVMERVRNDPEFAQELLNEAATLILNGEPDIAKSVLRDLVNSTVGFEGLDQALHKPSKSHHRMLSKSGNPGMDNLSAIFAAIKDVLHVKIETSVIPV